MSLNYIITRCVKKCKQPPIFRFGLCFVLSGFAVTSMFFIFGTARDDLNVFPFGYD